MTDVADTADIPENEDGDVIEKKGGGKLRLLIIAGVLL